LTNSISKGNIGFVLGPLLFLLILFFSNPEGLSEEGVSVLAVTIWIAIWWISEAVPIEVTALLPIVLFPLTGGPGLVETCASYAHKYIFLFMGGFILAIAIEKWNLHKRIALVIINRVGTNLVMVIWGFMLSTAFLSMWISNTATTVMMLPIGMAIITQLGKRHGEDANLYKNFSTALMLAIAYSASIGGMATLIGTPPNLILAGVIHETYGIELSFAQWFKFGLPISGVLLFICWKYLTKIAFKMGKLEFPGGKAAIKSQLHDLGKMSKEEKVILVVFISTALAWISRSLILTSFIPALDDTIIAISSAVILFTLPSSKKGEKLINWHDAMKLPWGILILFGGGIALAVGFQNSGLAAWIAGQLASLSGIHLIVLLLILVAAVNFLTEITSNLATASVLLPILAPLALAMDVHPFGLMVGCTLAASCAFMLPVATPPNAIVFGSGHIALSNMIKTGVWLNIFSIVLITLIVYFVLPEFWNFDISSFPPNLNSID
jgi:solute carrier family 13 (sodium-dependent dicarboxylate transporter), member 2/3/5